MAFKDKIVIRLTGEQREALRRRAHILLKTDADGPDAWPDQRIAEALALRSLRSLRPNPPTIPRRSLYPKCAT